MFEIYIYIYIYVYVIYCRAGNYYPGFGSDPRSVAKIGYSGWLDLDLDSKILNPVKSDLYLDIMIFKSKSGFKTLNLLSFWYLVFIFNLLMFIHKISLLYYIWI